MTRLVNLASLMQEREIVDQQRKALDDMIITTPDGSIKCSAVQFKSEHGSNAVVYDTELLVKLVNKARSELEKRLKEINQIISDADDALGSVKGL